MKRGRSFVVPILPPNSKGLEDDVDDDVIDDDDDDVKEDTGEV